MKFTASGFALLLAAVLPLCLAAQSPSDGKNYIRASYQSSTGEGILTYMAFHDHSQRYGNLPYHQHHYYNPFWQVTEVFHRYEISGQYYLNSRTFAHASLPYQKAVRNKPDDVAEPKTSESGLGDLRLGGGYELFRTDLFKPNARINHVVALGATVKLPTGKFADFDEVTNELEPHFMPGAGTFNFSLNAFYRLHWGRLLAATRISGHLNTGNKFGFRYGHQMNAGVLLAYSQPLGKAWRAMPTAGISYRYAWADIMDGKPIAEDTGGQFYQWSAGLAAACKNVELGFEISRPLKSKPIGLQPMPKQALALRLEYQFARKRPVSEAPYGKGSANTPNLH